MITREQLLKSPEHWITEIQLELYRAVHAYMEREGLNQTQLAEKLGVSKGYISQVLNGNFNFTLRKLVELSLAVGKVPTVTFKDVDSVISQDKAQQFLRNRLAYFSGSLNLLPNNYSQAIQATDEQLFQPSSSHLESAVEPVDQPASLDANYLLEAA